MFILIGLTHSHTHPNTSIMITVRFTIHPSIHPSIWTLGAFSVYWSFYAVGGTPCTGDQPVARPLPAHRTTQTQIKRKQISMPQVGFEPSVWARENSSCLRPRGHCDRPCTVSPEGKWPKFETVCPHPWSVDICDIRRCPSATSVGHRDAMIRHLAFTLNRT
jgi:hypothetical protein